MPGPVIPPALKFWRLATALASGLALLYIAAFWVMQTWVLDPFKDGGFVENYMLCLILLSLTASLWLRLQFFPPQQNDEMHLLLIHWLESLCGLAFLSGFLGTLFIPMVSCFECAMWILLAALVPGLFLLLPVCLIFRRVRVQR